MSSSITTIVVAIAYAQLGNICVRAETTGNTGTETCGSYIWDQSINARSPTSNAISYYLATRETVKHDPYYYKDPFDTKQLQASELYNKSKRHVFIIHGWRSNISTAVNEVIARPLLRAEPMNVFIVNWEAADSQDYPVVRTYVVPVGRRIAAFISKIKQQISGVNLVNLTIIGHSLGAHVAGAAGTHLKKRYKIPLPQIVGLDPPRIQFYYPRLADRLDRTDAEFVQVLHTSWLTFDEQIGHADYIFNDGFQQPGCSYQCNYFTGYTMPHCAHARAFMYYGFSIKYVFIAHRCHNYNDYAKGLCANNPTSRMGGLHTNLEYTDIIHGIAK